MNKSRYKMIIRDMSRYSKKLGLYIVYYPPKNPFLYKMIKKSQGGHTDAEPFKILWVSPEDISRCSRRSFDRWKDVGRVRSGNWDINTTKFVDASFYDGINSPFYKSLKTHFKEGTPWEETEFIKQVMKCVGSGKEVWECSSVEQVQERCRRVDKLYESIKDNGYQTQRELMKNNIESLKYSGRKRKIFKMIKRRTVLGFDEIAVDISRDGEFLFYDCKHRLAIAKLLNINEIPVRVIVRHAKWQKERNKYRNKLEVSPAHPDLKNIN